jgi:5-formyltetrahydrofolate cyclo-ligase
MTITEQKAELRRHVIARVRALTSEKWQRSGHEIPNLLQGCLEWSKVRTVGLFWSHDWELDLSPVWQWAGDQGLRLAAPAFLPETGRYVWKRVEDFKTEMNTGRFGVAEPAHRCPEMDASELDWLLVPGVAFDAEGGRLGRGKGHYDRWLLGSSRGIRCGIGFEEQVVPKVPLEPHDIRLHYVLTPEQVRNCQSVLNSFHAN